MFYKHTWSLAVEIQFYLIVPFLFFTFEWLNKWHKGLKFGLMALIGAISFALQSLLKGDSSHMLLVARLWQFMCGFGTFYLHESGWLSVDRYLVNEENEEETAKTLKDSNGV